MSTFVDKLKIVIEAESAQFKSTVKSMREEVGKADTALGKMKAAGSSAMKTVSDHAAAFAIGAGAALVTWGIKAVGAFEDTAKAAIDLGKATGLSTEQASRWIAVADDWGVTAEDLAKGIGKIDKTIDANKWAQYGIATRDAAGNAKDANTLFLDALDLLDRTPNKTEQARIGFDLFGKGFQSLAPMLGHTRGEYEQLLGTVKDGEVITGAEADKAEKMRLAQVELGKAVHDVTLSFGEAVAGAAPFLKLFASTIGVLGKAVSIISGSDTGSISGALAVFTKSASTAGTSTADIANNFGALAHASLDAQSSLHKAGFVLKDLATGGGAEASEKLSGIRDAFSQLSESSPADAAKTAQALLAVSDAADAGNKNARDYMKAWGLTHDVIMQFVVDSNLAAGAARDKAANDERVKGIQDTAKAYDAAAQKARDFIATQKTLYGDQRDDIQRQRDLGDATRAYAAALKGDPNSAFDSAVKLAEAQATLNGTSLDTQTGVNNEVVALQTLASTLDPKNPLRVQLDAYIAQLKAIPGTVDTKLSLTGSGLSTAGNATTAGGDSTLTPRFGGIKEPGVVINGPVTINTTDNAKNTLTGLANWRLR